jgi:hypothetical protein
MLSKPASRADAFAQLRRLSGRTHLLHSAAGRHRERRTGLGPDRDGGVDGPATQRRLPSRLSRPRI